jgi:hypothetical protein
MRSRIHIVSPEAYKREPSSPMKASFFDKNSIKTDSEVEQSQKLKALIQKRNRTPETTIVSRR